MRILYLAGMMATVALLISGCSEPADTKPGEPKPAPPAEHRHAAPAAEPQKNGSRKIDYWTCSMHPQIHADKPGNCPICGMTLVPVYAASSSSSGQTTVMGGETISLTEEGIRQAGVGIEKAQKRELTKDLLLFGTIAYDLNLHWDVVALVSGRIEKQFINFNQTEIKKGDPLVSLYSPEAITLQEEYLKAQRDRWLSTFYERDLLTSAIRLAEEKLQQIGFSREDIAKLGEEKKLLEQVIVRAPNTGTIVGNMVHIGEYVKADQKLYHIVPLDDLWFNAQVFEPDIGLLKLGEKIRITTKSHPGEVFTGKLVFIDRELDVANRTVLVRFLVPNKERRLLPNLSASGSLEIPIGNVLSVPNTAVLDLGTRHIVYVQKEKGFYTQRDVRIGQVTQHYTQILDGLSAGDEVVVSGAFLIDAQRQLRAGFGAGETQAGKPEEPVTTPPMPAGHHH